MSYSKQTWQTGDVVTSAKLNHMEDGIEAAGGGALVVGIYRSQDTGYMTCDKTAVEMWAAYLGGSSVILFSDGGAGTGDCYPVLYAQHYTIPSTSYTFTVYEPSTYQNVDYTASADDAYPEWIDGGGDAL